MVKVFLGLICFASICFGDILSVAKTFLDDSTYRTQRNLINVLFSDKQKYVNSQTKEINTVEIVKTLKKNGLLTLSFNQAQQLKISFDMIYNPILSIRIINDALENLGYTYYLTEQISKHNDRLLWTIVINTQNLVDPVSLIAAFRDRNCIVKNIKREKKLHWLYAINAQNATLKTINIEKGKTKQLLKPNRAYWFDIEGSSKMQIQANARDNWFPLIVFFDKSLNAISEINQDKDKKTLHVKFPQNAKYMKISDKYTLDNIKRGLVVKLD